MDPNEKPPPYSPPESTVTYPPGSTMPYIPPPYVASAPYNAPNYVATVPPSYIPSVQNQPGIPTYGAVSVPVSTTIIVGGCPVCRRGILQETYPCCALCLAIACFPIGICCCLAMKQRQCSACGATFQ